ncbi:anti-sigma factor family protein [Geodermatophilus sp. SYSU D00691]
MSIPESHLAQEAIAALVDGELTAGPARRAAAHLTGCAQCRMAVQAQREAKEALHRSQEVAVPGDLLSRLCAIPFTTDVPGSGGPGTLAAGPDSLTVSGATGSWAVSLRPHRPGRSDSTARWLRRGVTGTLAGLGIGVAALALSLPAAGELERGTPSGPVARPSLPEEQTEGVPPVVRTLTGGTATVPAAAPGGTP